MLRQFLRKRAKILRGYYRSRVRRDGTAYEPGTWWDEQFFVKGLSDRQTILPTANALTAAYHYASVEMLIARYLRKQGFHSPSARICDLGSGSGHWIDFYLEVGARHCTGIDISSRSKEFLDGKYAHRMDVTIHQGRILDVLKTLREEYELVNAIGIMFHLVDDAEWNDTIAQAARVLRPGGLFVVGGHFGLIDNVNVQYDGQNRANKKLRSASHWWRALSSSGFAQTRIFRNRAYLFFPDFVPENNLLFARKSQP